MPTIAVTSEDFRRISGHAGRCRRFLIYRVASGYAPELLETLELPAGQALHAWGDRDGHPVFEADVVLSQSAGEGFVRKLEARGIEVALTTESDPVCAIRGYLAGTLARAPAHHCLTQGVRHVVSRVLGFFIGS
jgi:predicted Fe-Mo cluster-binding NifX family protein